ncbi:MAG: response regulator [Phycisphaerales bacterium]
MSNFSSNSSSSGSTRPCVVLVDDEPHITHMVARKLTQIGYEVHTAMDGQQGLKMIIETMPDLVVTDLQMPYMSGIELSTKLWESEKTQHIPLIMLTARGFAVESEVRELGNVRELLSKPFGIKALVDLIGSMLASEQDGSNRGKVA